jgi:hypothetical protein
MDATKLLELDPEQVQGLAEAYEGLARSEPPDRQEAPPWKRANDFVIAGAYWALSDPPHAWKLFSEAANLYLKSFVSQNEERKMAFMSSPAWMFKAITLAVSAADTSLVRETVGVWRKQPERFVTPDLVLAELLAASFLTVQGSADGSTDTYFQLAEIANAMPAHPVGRLGWPLSAYSRTMGPLIESRRSRLDPPKFFRLLSPFADRLSDTIRSAQSSSYHWRRLYTRLLPIEPEAMAVCQAAQVILDKQELPPEEKRKAFAEFPAPARAYFEVATETGRNLNREQWH